MRDPNSGGPGAVPRLFDIHGGVAFVGATERSPHAARLVHNFRLFGYGGPLGMVNPRYRELHGITCVPSIKDLDFRPDLAIALVSHAAVGSVVSDAGAVGCGTVMAYTGGFADDGAAGRARQDALLEQATENGVTLLGPNTLGYIAPAAGIGAWVGDSLPQFKHGETVIVGQSSGMLNLILPMVARRQIPFEAGLSVGNEAMIDAADVVDHFAAAPGTKVIGLVLESTNRPRKLAAALARARAGGKLLVILKFGNSELGQRNALSHSGRLGSNWRAWTALFSKVGATVVDDIDEFLNALSLAGCVYGSRFATGGVGFVANSGGDCGLVSDIAERTGLRLAAPSAKTAKELGEALGHELTLANPLDVGNTKDDLLGPIVDVLMGDDQVELMVARLRLPWTFRQSAADVYTDLAARARARGKHAVVVSRAAESLDQAWFEHLAAADVPLLISYGSGLRAIHALLDAMTSGESATAGAWSAALVPETAEITAPDEQSMTWGSTQQWLTSAGLPYVRTATAVTAADACAAAAGLGLPVCVKAVTPTLVHKAAAGGVRLNLDTLEEVAAACAGIESSVRAAGYADFAGYEVQPMVPAGIELIVGMWRDPLLGPVITVGAGGTSVERTNKIFCALPTLQPAEVAYLLSRLEIGLDELRPDVRLRLIETICAFAQAVASAATPLAAVDLNPVVVSDSDGVKIVDAHVSTLA